MGVVGSARSPMLPGFGRVARDDPGMDRHYSVAPMSVAPLAMEANRRDLKRETLMLV